MLLTALNVCVCVCVCVRARTVGFWAFFRVTAPVGVGEELALCLYNKGFQTLSVVLFCLVSLLQTVFLKAL